MDFSKRSYQKELLDEENLPFSAIRQNLVELEKINHYLGGHAVSVYALKKILSQLSLKEIHICEIGCGGGDNLIALGKWCRLKGIEPVLTGIDNNPSCIRYAEETSGTAIRYILSDYQKVVFETPPDIIFNSLFCHHFSDEGIVSILQWMSDTSRYAFFINDLHRHPLAFHSIKIITNLFSQSYLVKNDAPLSVRRAFVRTDWESYLAKAGIAANIEWKWAFRWLIYSIHEARIA